MRWDLNFMNFVNKSFAITFAGTSIRGIVQNKRSFQNSLPVKIIYKPLYSRHVVIVHFLQVFAIDRFDCTFFQLQKMYGKQNRPAADLV